MPNAPELSRSSDHPGLLRLLVQRLRAESSVLTAVLAVFAVPVVVGCMAAGAEAVLWHVAKRQALQQANTIAVAAASKRSSSGINANCAIAPTAASGSDAAAPSCGVRLVRQSDAGTDKRIRLIE